MENTAATVKADDLAGTLTAAIETAERWRRQAGHDSEEAARRDRLVWQLQHIAKQMLTSPTQRETHPR